MDRTERAGANGGPCGTHRGGVRRSVRYGVLGALLLAGPAPAETLDTSMHWALRDSYDRKADDARQAAAEARVLGGYEAFLPTAAYVVTHRLDSNIRYSPDFTSTPEAPIGIDTVPRRQPEVEAFQLSLPLFDGLRRYHDLESARSAAAAGRELQNDKTQQILYDTASAYLAVLRDRTILRLRQVAIADVAKVARSVAVKLEVHDATLADSALAESRVTAAIAAHEQAKANLLASELALARLAGPTANPSGLPRIPSALLPRSLDELRSTLLQTNPRLLAARLNADSAASSAKVAYARFAPQLNFVFAHTRQGAVSNYPYKVRDTSAMLQARIPIYDPGEFADVARGHALADQRSFESLDLERTVLTQASTAFVQRTSLIVQTKLAAKRVRRIEDAVLGRKMELRLGSMTIVDLLNTLAELTEANVAKINIEFERDRITYSLASAMNRLRV